MEKFLNVTNKNSASGGESAGSGNSGTGSDSAKESNVSLSSAESTSCTSEGNKRKKISFVWKAFKKSNDKKFAKCVYCGKEYKTSGNTSNLKDHLRRFHSKDTTFGSAGSGLSETSCSSITSIDTFFKRSIEYDSNSKRKKELDQTLALMIAGDLQPFSIVNDTGFRTFVSLLDPRYVIPSKYTIRENIMKKLYMTCCENLKKILNNVDHVSITMDFWSSVANDSYLTTTCHFVDPENSKINTVTLATTLVRHNHTSEIIAEVLRKIFHEWCIEEKVFCIVSDNASNMIKTCEILKKKHLPCYAHSLNLAVQDNLGLSSIQNISKRCKNIVTFIRQSNIASDMFRDIQQNSKSTEEEVESEEEKNKRKYRGPYKLIQEVPTRWNSFLHMIDRILQTSDALNQVLLKISKAPAPLTNDELTILSDLKRILICIDEATDKISGRDYVTISLIIPMSFGIYNYLLKVGPELISEEGKSFCNGLIESVQKRLFPYESRSVTRMSTLLDPRFKKEGFRSQENANQAALLLEQEINCLMRAAISTEMEKENAGKSQSTNSNESPKTVLFSFLQQRINQKPKSIAADAIIRKRQYLETQNTSEKTDPLLFWKVNGNDLAPMHKLCEKYFCIPGSSAEAERNFSTTNQIISDRRSRLKPENVNILTFLKKKTFG